MRTTPHRLGDSDRSQAHHCDKASRVSQSQPFDGCANTFGTDIAVWDIRVLTRRPLHEGQMENVQHFLSSFDRGVGPISATDRAKRPRIHSPSLVFAEGGGSCHDQPGINRGRHILWFRIPASASVGICLNNKPACAVPKIRLRSVTDLVLRAPVELFDTRHRIVGDDASPDRSFVGFSLVAEDASPNSNISTASSPRYDRFDECNTSKS